MNKYPPNQVRAAVQVSAGGMGNPYSQLYTTMSYQS